MRGHGHVYPNPDGSKARCGGPGLCDICSREYIQKYGKRPGAPMDKPEGHRTHHQGEK